MKNTSPFSPVLQRNKCFEFADTILDKFSSCRTFRLEESECK